MPVSEAMAAAMVGLLGGCLAVRARMAYRYHMAATRVRARAAVVTLRLMCLTVAVMVDSPV